MAFDQKYSLCLFLALFIIATLCPTHALVLDVGGSEGWNVDPPEDYNSWAAVMRFSINDTLHFKYDRTIDSVLEVSEDDYDKCSVNNPIVKMDDGASAFTLNHSGPFHFISGNKSHCEQGQKLLIIVLSDHNKRHEQPHQAPSASPAATHASSPAPLAAAISQAPAPATTTATSPTPTPSASSSTTIPSDVSAPAPAPADHSSARAAFNAGGSTTTVSFVIISMALVGLIG